MIGILNGATYEVTATSDGWLELDGTLEVCVHREPFVGLEVEPWRARDAEMFEYGYALTCHKSQGSQWDRVGVMDESAAFGVKSASWLYTAITRAAKDLWVVRA
jgi:exodeoxyribonuclease-5